MNTALAIKRNETPTALPVLGKFGAFKPETEQVIRAAEVEMNPKLEGFKRAWKDCIWDRSVYEEYDKIAEGIKNVGYSSEDVEKSSIILIEFQKGELFSWKAGLFLSAMMNNSKDDAFVVHTSHLSEPIDFIGYLNKKKITVEGNAGGYVGEKMECGDITVEGYAGDYVGRSMNGGTITVNGDAGYHVGGSLEGGIVNVLGSAGSDIGIGMRNGAITVRGHGDLRVGYYMTGGSIKVGGKTKGMIGHGMEGGELHIDGGYRGISKLFKAGKIFHKGELIIDK